MDRPSVKAARLPCDPVAAEDVEHSLRGIEIPHRAGHTLPRKWTVSSGHRRVLDAPPSIRPLLAPQPAARTLLSLSICSVANASGLLGMRLRSTLPHSASLRGLPSIAPLHFASGTRAPRVAAAHLERASHLHRFWWARQAAWALPR